VNGSFHNAQGQPLVNTTTFPDMGAMVKNAHSLGLAAGFYINNCICGENMWRGDPAFEDVVFQGTVKAIVDWGYDGVKIDSCSEFSNMTKWASLFATTGKPMVLEDCHNSDLQDPCPQAMACPETGVCPYNMWRNAGDIGPSWSSIFHNLQLMLPWLGEPSLSRPGRWAYPDMMQVGQMGCGKDCVSNYLEDRAHFGAWVICSAPLTLGYDLADDNVTEHIWPIISNTEAIGINQQWEGHPGKLLRNLSSGAPSTQLCGGYSCDTQLWLKPLNESKVAVLLLSNADPHANGGPPNRTYTINLSWLGISGGGAKVRDVWSHDDLPEATATFTTDAFGGHDSRLLIFTPLSPSPQPPPPSPAAPRSCEQSCLLGTPGGPTLGHCCIGLNSSGSMPSCAMGCLMGEHTQSLAQCEATCMVAARQCSFRSGETGNQTLNMCANCYEGPGLNCGALFAVNDSTCTVQSFEAWAPHRGCGDYGGDYASDCKQGCLFHYGCPTKPAAPQ
jgi:hypothetical protein